MFPDYLRGGGMVKRTIRGVLSVALFSFWMYGLKLIVLAGAKNYLEFTAGAVFGGLVFAALNYAAWRCGAYREDGER